MDEDSVRIQNGDIQEAEIRTCMKAAEEARDLEQQLQELPRVRSMEKMVEEEILQTKVIPLEQVRASMEEWREAFKKEYDNLTAGPVTKITLEEFERLKSDYEVEVVPAKAVATREARQKEGEVRGVRQLLQQCAGE